MQIALAVCASAALLLICSGLAKLRSPGPTVQTLDQLGLPGWGRLPRIAAVRALGLGEITAGATMLALGGRGPAAALAVLYLAFAMVVSTLLRRGRGSSCGCFGAADAPVSRAHLAVDLAAAAAAVAAAISPPAAPVSAVRGLAGAVLLGQIMLLTGLAYLSMTALPALAAARQKALPR